MFEIPVDEDIMLRRVRLESAARIFGAIDRNRGHLGPWLPFVDATARVSDTENFIRSVIESNGPKKDLVYEILVGDEFAGLVALKEIDLHNRKTELGYWITAAHAGRGIMTRSVRALLDYAFVELKMQRVQLKAGIGNTRSVMIAERLGFVFEGIERRGEKLSERFADLQVYSMLKEEWK